MLNFKLYEKVDSLEKNHLFDLITNELKYKFILYILKKAFNPEKIAIFYFLFIWVDKDILNGTCFLRG